MLAGDPEGRHRAPTQPAYRADSGIVTPAPGNLADPMAPAFDRWMAALPQPGGDQLYLAQGDAQTRDLADQSLVEGGAQIARRCHLDDLAGADAEAQRGCIGADLHRLSHVAGHGRDFALGDAGIGWQAGAEILVEEGVQLLQRRNV